MPRDRMSISWDDLKTENVEKKIQQQAAISQAREHYENVSITAPTSRKPRFTFIYNTVFYMGLFGALGGLVGWGFGILLHLRPNPQQEARDLVVAYQDAERAESEREMMAKYVPKTAEQNIADSREIFARQIRGLKSSHNDYFDLYLKHKNGDLPDKKYDSELADLTDRDNWKNFIADLFFYGIAGMMIAACLGMAESVVERNMQGALIQGSVGAAVGLVGGVVVSFFDDRIFSLIAGSAGSESWKAMLARATQWAVLGLFLTLGPGLLLRNFKKLMIGLAGGLIGGIAGGLLFEPMKGLAEHFVDNGEPLSRLVGLLAIGIVAGVGTGLIENAVKSGWFKVTDGLIAGKQFVLYRNPTYIGSSPQCHIYLFKDPQVGRRHAAVHVLPQGFEIEDLPLGGKTYVNGKPVSRVTLRNGDRIQIGTTGFWFQAKAKEKTA